MKNTVKVLALILAVLICAAPLAGSIAPMAFAEGNPPIDYIDENGAKAVCTEYRLLNTDEFPDEEGVELTGGWYVVKGDVTFNNRVKINAPYDVRLAQEYADELELYPVRIILCDGCSINFNNGIQLEMDNGLYIYAQKRGTGKLNAEYNENGGADHAVIGGNEPRGSCGYIDISGGDIPRGIQPARALGVSVPCFPLVRAAAHPSGSARLSQKKERLSRRTAYREALPSILLHIIGCRYLAKISRYC